MIEFVTESDEFVVLNPSHIVYIKNDNGSGIIKVVTNEQFIIGDYNEAIARFHEASTVVYLDKEGREALEEAVPVSSDEESA